MARKSEQTLDFWQFDTGLFDDGKIIDLNDKYGPVGEAIYFRILSHIAKSNGYYACFDKTLVLLVYRSIGNKWIKSRQFIEEVIFYCGECGLFDVRLLQRKIISSRGIQRRWLYAKKKSRARGYSTTEFWLLNEKEPQHGAPYDSENYCNNNSDNCNNNSLYISQVNTNPPLPPKGGGEEGFKEKFYSLYPKLKVCKNYDDSGVDYKILLERFATSTRLQQTYSMKWVCENYGSILNGVFTDAENGVEQRVERERWYASRQQRAEAKAERFEKRAMQNGEYKAVCEQISTAERESAKAEAFNYPTLPALLHNIEHLREKRHSILNSMGIMESDLIPQYYCKKCSDSGFMPDGRACDCYKKE